MRECKHCYFSRNAHAHNAMGHDFEPYVDPAGNMPGGKYCAECGISTNHTTAQHREAEQEGEC